MKLSGEASSPEKSTVSTIPPIKTAVIFDNLGPYHLARLQAAASQMELLAVQVAGRSVGYAWEVNGGLKSAAGPEWKTVTLLEGGTSREIQERELENRMNKALNDFHPQVVFIPGWSGKTARAALSLCVRNGIPAVVMSESTSWDERRVWWKEWAKRKLVGMHAAALVGGTPHKEYLMKLGMPADRILLGYDVVDNRYFADKAAECRKQRAEFRRRYELPENYFLASARFLEKKNLSRLLQAYARYRQLAANAEVWDLVLLGDGPLRPDLCRLVSGLGLDGCVHLPGFKQYADLPAYYGLARAFLHASTTEQWGLVVNEAMASGLPVLVSNRCGCARDLVVEGRNGFTFDPCNIGEMAQLMLKLSAFDFPLSLFADASLEIVAKWGPAAFSTGLLAAASAALQNNGRLATLKDKLFLRVAGRGLSLLSMHQPSMVSGRAAEKRLLVFHFGQRKVLALPSQPRALHPMGVARHQGHTPKRRAYQYLASAAVAVGAQRLLSSSVPINDVAAIDLDYKRWMEMLQERLGKSSLQAVLVWPPQTERQRVYLHVFDERMEPCAFVKTSKRTEDWPLMENGFNALLELEAFPFQRLRLPRALGHGVFDGTSFVIQQPLPSNVRTLKWKRDADVLPLIQELWPDRKRLDAEEIMQLSWWKRYTGKLSAGCGLFHQELMSRLARGAEVGRVHGDFGTANMSAEGNYIWLVDWESTHPQGPVLTDAVGYFVSFGKMIDSPNRHVRDFTNYFLNNGDPQHRLDVMLALAYRHSSGMADAEVYMRHCLWHGLS